MVSKPPDANLLALLLGVERALLYVISLVLLAVAAGVLVAMSVTLVRTEESWAARFVTVLEDLLLILIVLEIFATVVAHLEGGRLQLEPFIIVGIIAVIRHILSIVVRLSIPEITVETRAQLLELTVHAGVAALLVLSLALVRWSQRRPSGPPAQAA